MKTRKVRKSSEYSLKVQFSIYVRRHRDTVRISSWSAVFMHILKRARQYVGNIKRSKNEMNDLWDVYREEHDA